ncbi:MAG: DUF4432 family protein, partial [Planctomycetota bacterium]
MCSLASVHRDFGRRLDNLQNPSARGILDGNHLNIFGIRVRETEDSLMATKKWVFIDTAEQTYCESARLDGGELGRGFDKAEIAKSRLRGGLSDGVEVVGLDNGRMQLTILPTRGMGIWQAVVDNLRLGWQAPTRGPVHPAYVPIWDPSGLGWLDGFDELVVRCGLESNGAPEFHPNGTLRYPLHGKIANRPAHKVVAEVDEDAGTLAVVGEVDETRLFFTKLRLSTRIETRVGSTSFTITDTVENLSAEPTDMELLYHINFGTPLLKSPTSVDDPDDSWQRRC